MKNIGILTYYYQNYNYGGLLQAYALRKVIADLGYGCEQISFMRNRKVLYARKVRGIFEEPVTKDIFRVRLHILKNRNKAKKDLYTIHTRKKFEMFMDSIPHSEICNSTNVHLLNQTYDAFIAGSDQIWNPLLATDEYFLNFVEDDKLKISYAASIRINNFEKKESERIKQYLARFKYISVREEKARRLLIDLGIKTNIEVLPDPTFLLSRFEWDDLATDQIYREKYIMAYLVRDANSIEQIKSYARAKNLKVILVEDPGYYFEEDDTIVKLDCGIGPKEFVSLIKNAELVIVNSFHGTVFSILYNKLFYVYGDLNDDDRKKTLLEKLGLEKQMIPNNFCFCDAKKNVPDFAMANNELKRMREYAIQQLECILQE